MMTQYKNWTEVPSYLKSKSFCQKARLITKGVLPVAQVYQKLSHTRVDLYDISQLKEKKPLSDKQKEAIEKRQKHLTCTHCKNYSITVKKGICSECRQFIESDLYTLKERCEALQTRLEWLNNPSVVILDFETTGLDDAAEVVEIGVIDLQGKVLFHSLVRPMERISDEVSAIHGITNKMVAHAPDIGQLSIQLEYVLKDKLILTYNAEFDERVFNQSLSRYQIKIPLQFACIMSNERQRLGLEYYLSLKKAAGETEQSHRAIGDCMLALKVITQHDRLEDEINKCKESIKTISEMLN